MRPIPLAPPVTRTTLPCGDGCVLASGTFSHAEVGLTDLDVEQAVHIHVELM